MARFAPAPRAGPNWSRRREGCRRWRGCRARGLSGGDSYPARLPHGLPVIVVEFAVDVAGGLGQRQLVANDLAERRQARAVVPGFWLPQIRAHEGLGAVHV